MRRARRPPALLLGLLLVAGLAPTLRGAERSGAPITVLYPEPRSRERFVPIVLDGVRYVSTNDLARVFGATKYWRPEIKKLSLRIGDHTLRFTVDAPVLLVDEEPRNLVNPARLVKGTVYAPEALVAKMFEWGVATDAAWDETSRTIRFREPSQFVRQAQLVARGRVTEVSAAITKSLPARLLYATPGEIRVLFEGGTLDTARVFAGGVVTFGQIREVAGGVDLRLVLADSARGYQVSVSANRLKVAVTNDPGLVEGGLFAALEPVRIGQDGDAYTIVIDPGHGGAELGATLPGGMAEKDVSLEIARSLRSALQGRLNARVLLTRDSDIALGPGRRAEIANESGADLFISIHLEGEGRIKGGGFRVLAQSPTAVSGDAATSIVLSGVGDPPELRPWLSAQAGSVGGSMALAQAVADGLARSFTKAPVIMRTGQLSVLEPVLCPAIILESAPAGRSGSDAVRGYTTYEYSQVVARAIEEFVRRSRA